MRRKSSPTRAGLTSTGGDSGVIGPRPDRVRPNSGPGGNDGRTLGGRIGGGGGRDGDDGSGGTSSAPGGLGGGGGGGRRTGGGGGRIRAEGGGGGDARTTSSTSVSDSSLGSSPMVRPRGLRP